MNAPPEDYDEAFKLAAMADKECAEHKPEQMPSRHWLAAIIRIARETKDKK